MTEAEAAAIKFLAIGVDDSENRVINGKDYQKIRVRMEDFIDEEFNKIYFYLTMSRFFIPVTSLYDSENEAIESMKEKFGDLFDNTNPDDMFFYNEIEGGSKDWAEYL